MSIVDAIFSSVFYMTTIIMVWMFTFVGLSFYRPFKNKNLNVLYKGGMFVVACLIMVVPMFLYYGLATHFETITMGRTTFCLMEKYERGGGESPSETVCRLSILDKNTGERKDRRYIGHTGELLGQKGDTVIYLYNEDLVALNTHSLEEIYHVNKDEWSQRFPDLNDGIQDVHANQHFSEPHKLYIEIRGKNGNQYWYEPFTRKLSELDPPDQKVTGIYSTGYDLYFLRNQNDYQQAMLTGAYVNNSERKKIAPGDHYKYMFGPLSEESFIEPKFLCIDTAKKCFVFAHYRTTDRKAVWIEAKDFNFKTLWKKNSDQLEANDSYNLDGVQVARYEGGYLYVNMGGFMLCLDPLTGKARWKVRL